jgi:4a-hydroxytetrahydrobiopterin dehydratase
MNNGADLKPLDQVGIETRVKSLSGWKYENNKIFKEYEFPSFTEAVKFVDGLVAFCNEMNHHPDILIRYKKVKFELSRFDIGGKVTARDFTVAEKIEGIFQNRG